VASSAIAPGGAFVQDAERFIEELGVALPDRSSFTALADLTALRTSADGGYYASNYVRGPLLYALVAARRPAAIIEFGTGRGYGALCMARALVDHEIDGLVRTVDLVPADQEIAWAYADDRGPRVERWTRQSFWAAHVPRAWAERIVSLVGRSPEVIDREARRIPPIDLAFIDGGHDRAAARHDILAAAALGSDRLGMLLDDVAERPGFGVATAVRELLAERFPVVLIPADWGHGYAAGAGMAWVDTAGRREQRLALSRMPRRAAGIRWPWR
jgi:predicted O-methyltransferase YrrM